MCQEFKGKSYGTLTSYRELDHEAIGGASTLQHLNRMVDDVTYSRYFGVLDELISCSTDTDTDGDVRGRTSALCSYGTGSVHSPIIVL
jgi:hypothetical protein